MVQMTLGWPRVQNVKKTLVFDDSRVSLEGWRAHKESRTEWLKTVVF